MRRFPVAVTALLVSVPIVFWWLPGDLTDEKAKALAADGEVLDYAVEPLPISGAAELVIGLLACAVAIGAAVVLIRAIRAREVDRLWWVVLASLAAAGAVVGFGWRVLTAGGIGANVGAGLMLLFGVPLVAILGVVAALNGLAIRRRGRKAAHATETAHAAETGRDAETAHATETGRDAETGGDAEATRDADPDRGTDPDPDPDSGTGADPGTESPIIHTGH